MADIFISYAHADKEWAEALAEVLTRRGWTVWWDRDLGAGAFRRSIAQELKNARCVVVLWSPDSSNSEFVWNEASRAQSRDILVPVLIEEAEIPIGFEERQTFSLLGWDRGSITPEVGRLMEMIAGVLGRPLPAPAPLPKSFWINVVLMVAIAGMVAFWFLSRLWPLLDDMVFFVAVVTGAAAVAVGVQLVFANRYSRRMTRMLFGAAVIVPLAYVLTPAPVQLVRVAAGKNLFRYLNSTTDRFTLTVIQDGIAVIDKKPFTTFQTVYLGTGGKATNEEIGLRNGDTEHLRQLSEYLHALDAQIPATRIEKLSALWVARRVFWETPPLDLDEELEVVLATTGGTSAFRQKVERKPGEVIPTVFVEAPQ